eukprot:m.312523 g.312523  ORF g.312523 m.312523 type:complete len:1565 (-) comp19658_c4_seq13:178-4872(-)
MDGDEGYAVELEDTGLGRGQTPDTNVRLSDGLSDELSDESSDDELDDGSDAGGVRGRSRAQPRRAAAPRQGSLVWRRIKLLVWKELLHKRRSPITTLVEILIPVCLCVALSYISTSSPSSTVQASVFAPLALPSAGPVALARSFLCRGLGDATSDLEPVFLRASLWQFFADLDAGGVTLLDVVGLVADRSPDPDGFRAALAEPCVRQSFDDLTALAGMPVVTNRSGDAMRESLTCSCAVLADVLPDMIAALLATDGSTLVGELLTLLAGQPAMAAAAARLLQFPGLDLEALIDGRDMEHQLQLLLCPQRRDSARQYIVQTRRKDSDYLGFSRLMQFVGISAGVKVQYAPATPATRATMARANTTFDQLATLVQAARCANYIVRKASASSSSGGSDLVSSSDAGVVVERWTHLPKGGLAALFDDPRYPDNPAMRFRLVTGSTECPENIGSNFGQRMRFRFKAPIPGHYSFFLAVDDYGEIKLGRDSNHLKVCAEVPSYNYRRGYFEKPWQECRVALAAGQYVSMQVACREANGKDSCSLAVRLPNGTFHGPIPTDLGMIIFPNPLYGNITHGILMPDQGAFGFFNDLDVFHGFETEAAIDASVRQGHHLSLARILFHEHNRSSGRLDYTLRVDPFYLPRTADRKQPPWASWGKDTWYDYYFSGFVMLQEMVDRAFLEQGAQGNDAEPLPPTFVQQFPMPTHTRNLFLSQIGSLLPLVLTVSWLFPFALLVRSLVHEKEARLREAMKVMGVSTSVWLFSWWLFAFGFLSVTTVVMTLVVKYGGVCPLSDGLLVFILLEAFAATTVLLGFFVATLFSKAKLAAACAGVIYFVLYVPFAILKSDSDHLRNKLEPWHQVLASLSSTSAFGFACEYIGKRELMGTGVQWDNVAESVGDCDGFSFAGAVGMILLDGIIYFVAAWYIDAVFPGEFGVPRRWFFFVDPTYWRPRRSWAPSTTAPTSNSGVCIQNLTKEYPRRGRTGMFRAVDELCLESNTGITALLGGNGAGKTTTLSMLTGLIPPSRGFAWLNGHSILDEMDAIHAELGVCPQYNVMFPWLTVEEHLFVSATLRGVEADRVAKSITELLDDVDLRGKRHSAVGALSGGMQRRLCVAMAFAGSPTVVVLDEPTAGQDPAARRLCWDIVLRHKKGRTILLCTHHLDEADVLADNIAILDSGRLLCEGSPLDLKRDHARGHLLSIPLKQGLVASTLLEQVHRLEPGARALEVTPEQLTVLLPHTDSKAIVPITKHLASHNVNELTVSAPTLESAFLAVLETSSPLALPHESRGTGDGARGARCVKPEATSDDADNHFAVADNDDDDDDDVANPRLESSDEQFSDSDSDSDSDVLSDDDRGVLNMKKPKTAFSDDADFEVVPPDDPKANKKLLDAAGLAIAQEMINRRKKREMIDASYNRYTFNDDPLPVWFDDEEHQHKQPAIPMTKEMSDAIKAMEREINTRSVKKVLEAKARKKRKMTRKMDKARQQAQMIADNDALTEREKSLQIQKLYRKAAREEKREVKYVVARRATAGKRAHRPRGVTGLYKQVDGRMKKDTRSKLRAEEKKKGKKRKR